MLMGYLLKEALKTLCGVNQWSYAIFWKLGCQNPRLLIWEECYYEPISYSSLPKIAGTIESKLHFDNWEASSSQLPAPVGMEIHLLVNNMMTEKNLNVVGEGLVGRAAFTGNHEWILSEKYTGEVHPPEVLKEVCQQFSAGMQTIAVIPVLPHGVVQLGSRFSIMETLAFVNDAKSLVLQLGCVPGILLSDNYTTKESGPTSALPVYPGKTISVDTTNSTPFIQSGNYSINSTQTATGQIHDKLKSSGSTFDASNMARDLGKSHDEHCQAIIGSLTKLNIPSVGQLSDGATQASLCGPGSTFHQQFSINSIAEDTCCLRFSEQRIFSDNSFQNDYHNNLNMSDGFMMSPLASTYNNAVITPSLEVSELYKDVYSHLKTVANLDSLQDANTSSTKNISSMNLAGNGFQHASSSKTEESSSHMIGNLITNHLLCDHHSADNTDMKNEMKGGTENELFRAFSISQPRPHSADDLFDILGVDFRNKLLNDSWNSIPNNGFDSNLQNFIKNKSTSWTSSDLYSVNQRNSECGIFSAAGPDHVFDAIISTVHPPTKQIFDDNVSCKTTLTNMSSSSVPDTSCSNRLAHAGVSDQMQGEIFGVPKSFSTAGSLSSCSFRSSSIDNAGRAYSKNNSIYGSQISSWVEQNHDSKQSSSASTSYSKKSDEMSKTNRKRLKPGENPRPRPKDRQMIQDRVKELREIVPNGGKCSIDALLERTIKHMLFLQGVTKHADKLKQTGDSKIFCKEGGLLLKDNFEGGATWAYEVGSQSMVCPIIVEDLTEPRQMLLEMLCEERGLFLEIADIIRGLGLTILKGVMESRSDKIWARFAVEANRDVTRMEIFISLARLLEQTVKSGATPTNGIDMMI